MYCHEHHYDYDRCVVTPHELNRTNRNSIRLQDCIACAPGRYSDTRGAAFYTSCEAFGRKIGMPECKAQGRPYSDLDCSILSWMPYLMARILDPIKTHQGNQIRSNTKDLLKPSLLVPASTPNPINPKPI